MRKAVAFFKLLRRREAAYGGSTSTARGVYVASEAKDVWLVTSEGSGPRGLTAKSTCDF